jgi:type IV fimbrial biogenesis protein FimT
LRRFNNRGNSIDVLPIHDMHTKPSHFTRFICRPQGMATWGRPARIGATLVMPRRSGGFTLVELLATMTVFVVLTVIAASFLGSTISNNRAYTAQADLATSLALARSEAVRRGVSAGLSATTGTSGNEFGGGWVVFVDENGNGAFDTGEAVVRTHEAVPANAVTSASSATTVLFNPLGFAVPASGANFKACPVNGLHDGYAITIQPNGLTDVNPTTTC